MCYCHPLSAQNATSCRRDLPFVKKNRPEESEETSGPARLWKRGPRYSSLSIGPDSTPSEPDCKPKTLGFGATKLQVSKNARSMRDERVRRSRDGRLVFPVRPFQAHHRRRSLK